MLDAFFVAYRETAEWMTQKPEQMVEEDGDYYKYALVDLFDHPTFRDAYSDKLMEEVEITEEVYLNPRQGNRQRKRFRRRRMKIGKIMI